MSKEPPNNPLLPFTASLFHKFEDHTYYVCGTVFLHDNNTLVTGSCDQKIHIYDLQSKKLKNRIDAHDAEIFCMDLSPCGRYVVTGSNDTKVKIWDAWNQFQLVRTIEDHKDYVHSVMVSPNGAFLSTASGDGRVGLFDFHSGKNIWFQKIFEDPVFGCSFSWDSFVLAAGGADKDVAIWQISNQKRLITLKSHTANIVAVRFSLDNKYLFTGSHDNTVKMWLCRDWSFVKEFKKHSKGIYVIRQHHRWPYLIFTAGADGIVNIFNINTGEWIGSLDAKESNIRSMNFSPNGDFLAIGTHSNKTIIWKLQNR
jgi:WD40 repeat protein